MLHHRYVHRFFPSVSRLSDSGCLVGSYTDEMNLHTHQIATAAAVFLMALTNYSAIAACLAQREREKKPPTNHKHSRTQKSLSSLEIVPTANCYIIRNMHLYQVYTCKDPENYIHTHHVV